MSLVMDKYDVQEEEQSLKYFSSVFGVSQFLGALAVILVAVWMGSFGSGFAWSQEPDQQFHYHPLFMVIGLIFLYGEAILVYRVFRHEQKKFTKLLHGILHGMIFVFFVVGLKAVFDSHNRANIDNMYSAHSWIGLSTVLLFCLQYLFGFLVFFFPGLSYGLRSRYMPLHRFFGLFIFILAILSALMGLSERAAWHIFNPKNKECKENKFCAEATLVNFLALDIILYGLAVIYLVGNPAYRRRALPEEESMQHLTAD